MAISIAIQIDGATVRELPAVPYSSGMNAQSVLERAYGQTGFKYLIQYFGPLGYEVVSIDGIPAVQGTDVGYYWQFLVNGEWAGKGIDATYPDDGDSLAFSYTLYSLADDAAHAGTRLGALIDARRAHRSGA